MALRNVPMAIRVFFLIGFCIGVISLTTSFVMMSNDTWERAPDWLRYGSFFLCPASLGLMAGDNGTPQTPSLWVDAILILVLSIYNGVFYGAIGFLVDAGLGAMKRKAKQP